MYCKSIQLCEVTVLKLTVLITAKYIIVYGFIKFINKNLTRCNNVLNVIIPYLYEAQHVSGDTPPIIRSLKLHWQPVVFHNTMEGCWYV